MSEIWPTFDLPAPDPDTMLSAIADKIGEKHC
jgi:hypothetical protein